MANTFRNRVKNGWSAFTKEREFAPRKEEFMELGPSYSINPMVPRTRFANDKSIITSVYNRIGIDVAAIDIKPVKIDQNGRYESDVRNGLYECLTIEANIDQGARDFKQDIVMTMCTSGVAAIVPVDTDKDPTLTSSYDIKTMRVGEVVEFFPMHVRVSLYNPFKGHREDITLPKSMVAIVQNPLYSVMNEQNSTLQRLIRKLSLLDSIDEAAGSGKLDLIIQLPYVIKSEARQKQAEQRRKDLEIQLTNSKLGLGYTDGTEKITQLNRPVENNMLKQIEFLTEQLYSALGVTKEVFAGTADEKTMLNYFNRTIEPILTSITESMTRTFITKTARTQGNSVEFYRDPFKLVAVGDIAEIADKFTRNEIMSANELRSIIGLKPSEDPKADELRNSNMPDANPEPSAEAPPAETETGEEPTEGSESDVMSQSFDEIEKALDDTFAELGVDPNE